MRYEIERNGQLNTGRNLSANYEELLAARKVIKEMSGIGDISLDMAGSYLAKIDSQLPLARRIADQQIVETKNRREILGYITGGTFIAGLTFLFGKSCHSAFFSDEAMASRALAEKSKADAEKAKQEKFEEEATLGLTPSAQSVYGWRIFYPEYDLKISYQPMSKPEMDFQITNGTRIELPGGGLDGRNTAIDLNEYTRLDGVIVPSLDVTVKSGSKIVSPSVEKWLLRDKPVASIETRVVGFESSRERNILYLAISKSRPSSDVFRIQIMERVIK